MKYFKRFLSVLLSFAMIICILPATASISDAEAPANELKLREVDSLFDPRMPDTFIHDEDTNESEYASDDIVRVSIILEKDPVIDKGYPIKTIGKNKAAANYRNSLRRTQDNMTERIEKKALDGEKLDVQLNLTLLVNLISANVEYRQIDQIKKVSGVKDVVIEQVYSPSGSEEDASGTDANAPVYDLSGYTGDGTRIAIVDSGVNHEHQAFNDDAFQYSLSLSAPDANHDGNVDKDEKDAYKDSLDLMVQSDIKQALDNNQLNVVPNCRDDAKLYKNSKIPFAYNYCDNNLTTTNGAAGIHGSHVAGIAAANTYIKNDDGTYDNAADKVHMTGVAPDAQILNMKVFGSNACTDAVCVAAIEDAIVLGADVLNLSLGTAIIGPSCSDSIYDDILKTLNDKGILILGASGNDGSWTMDNTGNRPKKLYADDVSMTTITPPSSYADFMGVAWADGADIESNPTINRYSAYGIPGSLMLQPEITALGTDVYSVDGNTSNGYTGLSGTSMAAPEVAGMASLIYQFLQTPDARFDGQTFLERALAKNKNTNIGKLVAGLLMSTSDPMYESDGSYYSLLRQGAGLANAKKAVCAGSYIDVQGQSRGRVKAEVGDSKDNHFKYTFTIHNVSSKEKQYSLLTDMFTQKIDTDDGGGKWLSDSTRELQADITYRSGGKELNLGSYPDADVNKDNVTDKKDAQALLDYMSGKLTDTDDLDLGAGDLNHDDKTDTYDAHLLLAAMNKGSVTVPANDSITIETDIQVTEPLSDYPKGAYLEGFTYVKPIGSDESDTDVTHSIPILGYCGNWSEPSMYDRNSYIESLYGNTTQPYTTDSTKINYMTYLDADGNRLYQTGNPYESVQEYPKDRLARRSDDIIYNMRLSLIRPVGAMAFMVAQVDKDGNRKVKFLDSLRNHLTCAFPRRGSWNYSSTELIINNHLSDMNVTDGQTVEIGAVAVPEYYEDNGSITNERLTALIENNVLGSGAYMTSTVVIDDKKPECTSASAGGGKVTFSAVDNQYIAYIGLYSTNGMYKYASCVPEQDKPGETITHTFDNVYLQNGTECALVIGDYAGNTTTYRFTYGSRPSYDDRVLAYVRSDLGKVSLISQGDWLLMKPGTIKISAGGYATDAITAAHTDSSFLIAGADAADGFLWQACENGMLYAAPLNDINNRTLICELKASGMQTVMDLAFSVSDNMLYAVDGTNYLWRIDPVYGDVKKVQVISSEGHSDVQLYGLAIGNDSRVFATCYDEASDSSSMLIWNLPDQNADPAMPAEAGSFALSNIKGRYISLTWQQNPNCLLASCATNLHNSSDNNVLYKIWINGDSCQVSRSNDSGTSTASRLYGAMRGLVYIPSIPKPGIMENAGNTVSDIRLLNAPKQMIAGDTAVLSAAAKPWTAPLTSGQITWKSESPDIASIDNNGLLTALSEGTAKITVTYTAKDGKTISTSKTITITPAPNIQLSALFREEDGYGYWETFNTQNPNDRIKLSGRQRSYIVGTLNYKGDYLYVRDGYYPYKIDPDTFKTTEVNGSFAEYYIQGDAAPGRSVGVYSDFDYLCVNSNSSYSSYRRNNILLFNYNYSFSRIFGIGYTPETPAAIAYRGQIDGYSKPASSDTPDEADAYYFLTEDGTLYEMYIFEGPYSPASSDRIQAECNKLGKVEGINLSGVYDMQSFSTASMIYDQKTGYLALVSKLKNNKAKVQVIDPTTCELILTREFAGNIRQIGILYQHDYSNHSEVLKHRTQGFQDTASLPVQAPVKAIEGFSDGSVSVDDQKNTVTVELKIENTTNGLSQLSYDSSVLTFLDVRTSLPYNSYHASADGDTGTVKFAYADSADIEGQTVQVVFSYKPQDTEQKTTVHVKEQEKGNPNESQDLNERDDSFVLPAKTLQSISVSKMPDKTEYIEGTTFDDAGMELTLTYSDGTSKTITSGWTIGEYDFNTLGQKDIPVTYEDKSAILTVTVTAKSLTDVKITTLPDKLTYLEGKDELDTRGGKLTLYYNNGTSAQIDILPEMVTDTFDNTKIGKQTLTVNYNGFTATFEVTVKAKSIDRIEITRKPDKMEYIEGTEFDPQGMEVTIYYDNDTTETITKGWSLEYDFSTSGQRNVKVIYGDAETSLSVTVHAAPQPTDSPQPTPSLKPTDSPQPTPSLKPTDSPQPTPSLKPTDSPRPTPSLRPTDSPQPTPSLKPTDSPQPTPSLRPTDSPRPTPSQQPAESQQPAQSQQPDESQQPTPSQQPDESQQPTQSQQPDESQQPNGPQQPTALQQPAEPQQPAPAQKSEKSADSPQPSGAESNTSTGTKNKGNENPQTEDNTGLGIWVFLMFISGGSLIFLIPAIIKKRKRAANK